MPDNEASFDISAILSEHSKRENIELYLEALYTPFYSEMQNDTGNAGVEL